jgi:hypothetical protein
MDGWGVDHRAWENGLAVGNLGSLGTNENSDARSYREEWEPISKA